MLEQPQRRCSRGKHHTVAAGFTLLETLHPKQRLLAVLPQGKSTRGENQEEKKYRKEVLRLFGHSDVRKDVGWPNCGIPVPEGSLQET